MSGKNYLPDSFDPLRKTAEIELELGQSSIREKG